MGLFFVYCIIKVNGDIALGAMLFYFVLVAVASPWIELRYIMPVCGLIFVVAMYYYEQKMYYRQPNLIMYFVNGNIIKEKVELL